MYKVPCMLRSSVKPKNRQDVRILPHASAISSSSRALMALSSSLAIDAASPFSRVYQYTSLPCRAPRSSHAERCRKRRNMQGCSLCAAAGTLLPAAGSGLDGVAEVELPVLVHLDILPVELVLATSRASPGRPVVQAHAARLASSRLSSGLAQGCLVLGERRPGAGAKLVASTAPVHRAGRPGRMRQGCQRRASDWRSAVIFRRCR